MLGQEWTKVDIAEGDATTLLGQQRGASVKTPGTIGAKESAQVDAPTVHQDDAAASSGGDVVVETQGVKTLERGAHSGYVTNGTGVPSAGIVARSGTPRRLEDDAAGDPKHSPRAAATASTSGPPTLATASIGSTTNLYLESPLFDLLHLDSESISLKAINDTHRRLLQMDNATAIFERALLCTREDMQSVVTAIERQAGFQTRAEQYGRLDEASAGSRREALMI